MALRAEQAASYNTVPSAFAPPPPNPNPPQPTTTHFFGTYKEVAETLLPPSLMMSMLAFSIHDDNMNYCQLSSDEMLTDNFTTITYLAAGLSFKIFTTLLLSTPSQNLKERFFFTTKCSTAPLFLIPTATATTTVITSFIRNFC